MTNGILFGKFAPLHKGHIAMIYQANLRVDHLWVILSFDQKFLDTLPDEQSKHLTKAKRHLALIEEMKKLPCAKITVAVVDESDIPCYPEGSQAFADLIREATQYQPLTHVFSSEPDYDPYMKEFFPECKHVVLDSKRSKINISATEIRNNPMKHWDMISEAAKPNYVKTVAIIGIESTGKTTLAQKLSEHYRTVFVPEVGRHICEDEYASTEAYMKPEDYIYVAMKHKLAERDQIKYANKVMFSDTNNLITDFSMLTFGMTETSPIDFESNFDDLLFEMCTREKYDLVILLDSDVPWVYDPLRFNNTPKKRAKSQEVLERLTWTYQTKNLVKISGSYEERFDKAVQLVDKLLGENDE